MDKLVDVDLTEQGVFTWPDPEIDGWRNYRIEYGGCNEDCYWEGGVFLPPVVDSEMMVHIFEIMQVPEALKRLKAAVDKIHKDDVGEKSNWREMS
jgi:hypothetical protein